jgi:hypothetical protein
MHVERRIAVPAPIPIAVKLLRSLRDRLRTSAASSSLSVFETQAEALIRADFFDRRSAGAWR